MNRIRQTMAPEVEALKPVLAETYRAIARFQRQRRPEGEGAVRSAIARASAALRQFKPLVPVPKQVYFDAVAAPGDLPVGDLIMALDMAIGSMHCELEQRAPKAQPERAWSEAMLALLRQRSEERRVARRRARRPGVLCSGVPASGGVGVGRVRLLLGEPRPGEHHGEVLVMPGARPEWYGALAGCAALVADRGGAACHLAIIARELGVPAVVGAESACDTLRDGQWVEVDGDSGLIREAKT